MLTVAARCRISGIGNVELALVDTGAQWSLFGGELADIARECGSDMGWSLKYSTRLGVFDARCYRLDIELVADEGQDLVVDASVLLAPEMASTADRLGLPRLTRACSRRFRPGYQ